SSAASRRVARFASPSRAARTPSASSRECVASASSSARARATSRAASSWEAWLAAISVRRVATSLWSRFTVPRVAQPVARTARTAVAPKTRFIRGDASTRSKAKSTAGRVRGAGLEPAEHDHLHRPARGDFRVGCDDGEAVGEHHRAQDARALIAGEPRAVALGVARESDAQVSPPRAAVGDRRERPRDDAGPRDHRAPQHPPEGRPHEQLERHHGGHGIAGEPEDRTAAERAKGDRLAGAHRDLPDRKSTRELQSLAYLVCRLLLEKKKKKYRTVISAQTFVSQMNSNALAPRFNGESSRLWTTRVSRLM